MRPMMVAALAAGLFVVAPSPGLAQTAALRPIDRATVRIVAIRGAATDVGPGRNTGVPRVAAVPQASHGSGLAISPRLVVTAAHVTQGADSWAVILPNTSEGIAARPLYVDPEHDVAVLEVAARMRHTVPLRDVRQLQISQRLSASGYPLDVREPTPAAVTGELSRVSREGLLQLAMSVNPGNSGGPVIDERGYVVGILSKRGRPEQGIEGIAFAVPLEVLQAAVRRAGRARHRFSDAERAVAAIIPWLVSVEADVQPARVLPMLQRCLADHDPMRAEGDAIVAATSWNVLLAALERRNQPAAQGGAVVAVQAAAQQLAARTLQDSPYIRRHFPVLRVIAAGQASPQPPASAPQPGRAQ